MKGVALFSMLAFVTAGARPQPIYQYASGPAGLGARAAALGDAYAAESYDVTSMYWNPASLTFLEKSSLVINHVHEWERKAFAENVSLPLLLAANQTLALGASLTHIGYVQDNAPNGVRFVEFGLDLGYGISLTPAFSVGTFIGARHGKGGSDREWSGWMSLGMFYSPAWGMTYGAVYRWIGSAMRYSYDGVGHTLDVEKALPRSFQIGASWKFPTLRREPVVNLAVVAEEIFGQDKFRSRGGLELSPLKLVALRIGYIVESSSAVARYGIGVRTDQFQLDYAISPSRMAPRFDEFSLSIAL